MCGGICGPGGDTGYTRSRLAPSNPVKQLKTPYKSHLGTVLADWRTSRDVVQLYEKDGMYSVSWSKGLSSGAAGYSRKREAISEYNQHVPRNKKL